MKADPSDVAQEFRREIEGEVRFDAYSKVLYSTDASIWQVEPIGVVIPKHAADVSAAVGLAARTGTPILPRGGATSLSGQTVGHAVHIDFSKYMHEVLECNTEEGWVRVQPGVIQDQLNDFLRPLGFQFGPDTSTSNRATIGGMIGSNSAGAHSILHGKTIDHVLELNVVLADGSEACLGPLETGELDRRTRGESLENRLYEETRKLGEAYREEILKRFPRLLRRVSGYNLDELVAQGAEFGAGYSSQPGPYNLAKLIVGSEGTLAVVSEAKLRIVPLPRKKGLLVVHFRSLFEAIDAAPEIVERDPAAVEIIDDFILGRARASPSFRDRMKIFDPQAQALLLVEFYGDSEPEIRASLDELQTHLSRRRIGFNYLPLTDPARQKNIWQVRKESLGLLMGVKGDKKPVAFVEDPAVPVEKMPSFLRRFDEILKSHDARGGYYGHASVGCVHVRPAIDLKQASEIDKMGKIGDEVCRLVMEYGGAMSGEHGDGLARGKFNRVLFGAKIYEAFRETKALFDPHNILNPGKVVETPEPTGNLRFGSDYQSVSIDTHLDFSSEGGFARAVEMCNGMGACRKRDAGTMCPSYHATLEEEHSTRGRANALRAALSGALPPEEFTSPRMYEVLDLCLACKGCKRECPSNVDLAKIKYEFLAHYYEKHGAPLRARLFANTRSLNRWGSRFAPLSNAALRAAPVKWLLDRWLGIDARRRLPPFAKPDFETWFHRIRHKPAGNSRPKVVLFHDCFMTYNYPRVGRAATELLEQAGYEVVLAHKKCCGRPMISHGLIEQARQAAQHNVRVLEPYVAEGIPVLGCEPSCLLTLRDEYPDLMKGSAVEKVAAGSFLVDEFLVGLSRQDKLKLRFRPAAKQVLFHGHCHQKAQVGTADSLGALGLIPQCEVTEVDSGCCGMAGSFGFESEHYELSETIARQRLIPAVEAASQETEIAVAGVSCRQQISHFTDREPRHVVEILRDALAE